MATVFKKPKTVSKPNPPGFALVVTLSLMILLAVISVGLLGLAAVELRKSGSQDARATAMANARLALVLAVGQLQKELGDDRRITADASIFTNSKNPYAVGVWDGWSPDLASKTGSGSTPRVDYRTPKSQTGFRNWLVSSMDPEATQQLAWHTSDIASKSVRLFEKDTSGFDLDGEKIPVSYGKLPGSVAWAVTQENTKARINVSADDSRRLSQGDRLQAPSRPDLSNSEYLKQPKDNDWARRSATVCRLSQAVLETAYGADRSVVSAASKDYTTDSYSLLTNAVRGGVKADLNTGFEMADSDFTKDSWSDSWGKLTNPFRSSAISQYSGQKPLYRPVTSSAQASVQMNFPPASVKHKFNVNGAPTFDMLRAYYRTYRHLYSTTSGDTAFERLYSHISVPAADRVAGRPFGVKTQPSLAPVLDRVNMVFSIYAKGTGELCILLSPFVTIWNPYNVAIETEGLVVYPWIDMAVFWNWNVTSKSGTSPGPWNASLSRFVGEGYADSSNTAHGRSSRPYFYLHLTQTGSPVSAGTNVINPAIRLEPGEVRVFCLADNSRKELMPQSNDPKVRTWRMKAAQSATDLTNGKNGGIVLDMTKSIGGGNNFNYKLKTGDVVNSNTVEFDRNTYFYIMNMADSWQIKNPNSELMVEARPAQGGFPALPATPNLVFYGQIHSGAAFGKGRDSFTYPSMPFELINEKPQMVGSILTYHRTALSSGKPVSDLMFTTNPRQPYVTQYLGAGGKFQTGPHYESLMQGGTSLAGLTMETSMDGRNAFYGPSHSANGGRSFLPFFEVPRSPTISLGSLQHCDLTASAFGCPSQIGNSWASPYLSSASVVNRVTTSAGGDLISPMLGVYDASYLANEALFDDCYFSGAAPTVGSLKPTPGSPNVWNSDQVSETRSTDSLIEDFFKSPSTSPLRNPRMVPYTGSLSTAQVADRLEGPGKCLRLASHLLNEGGFNINSTSEEAWTAILSSLRGADPSSGNNTPQSRFSNIITSAPVNMTENNQWSGFRSLSDSEVKTLAKNIVAEVKLRGPFLSLGEFVNRRVSADRGLNTAGAIQSAIDKSGFNRKFTYGSFDTSLYPNPENILTPNTGTNTPGWLSQADVLTALAPTITPRSDTFIVRTLGEAKDSEGKVIATARLEALVQRVPDWVDPVDDSAAAVSELSSTVNKNFGRRFEVISVREIASDSSGNPI